MQRTYNSGPNLAGLILVALGVIFLLGGVIGLTAFVVSKIVWPVAMLVLGAVFLEKQVRHYRATGRLEFPWPVFLLLLGANGLFGLIGIHLFSFFSWPVLLILIGLWMLYNRR